jgi:AraC family transcriptional regulator, melibiose operon regulatory protein
MQMKNFIIDESLKELTKHHTVVMPIACYKTTINQNIHGYIPLHWHDEIQFVWIVKGEAIFQVNEDWIVVQEGDGLFINSGRLHMAREKDQSGCVYICLNVSPHFVLSQELYSTYVNPYIQATNLPYLYVHANEIWGKNIFIQKSLYLLQQGDSNITEVAYQVGFNSTSYFINKFRISMNMTPLAYKKSKVGDC